MIDRMPPLKDVHLTDQQRAAVALFETGPRGNIFGPFNVLLRSPEVLTHAQQLGEYLRFNSVLPKRARELAMLITGKECRQPFIWYVHEPVAREECGITDEMVHALAEGRRPRTMTRDDAVVYDFCIELFNNKMVSDATYDDTVTRFGEQGVIDIIGICAYFSLLGMAMNVSQMPLPADADLRITRFVERAV